MLLLHEHATGLGVVYHTYVCCVRTGAFVRGIVFKQLLLALTAVFILSCALPCFADSDKPPFLVIGHAGSPKKQPDNTLEGFDQALKDGANAIEMDLCITADQQVVAYHDWDPNSTIALARQAGLQDFKYRPWNPNVGNDYRRPVDELTLNELRKHYGYTINQDNSSLSGQAERTKHKIPAFEDIARWMSTKKGLDLVYLDIKIPAGRPEYVSIYIDRIYAAAEKYGVLDKLVFVSPHYNIAAQAKRYADSNTIPLKIGLDQELPASLIMSLDEKKYDAAQKASNLGLDFSSVGRPTKVTVHGGWSSYQNIVQRVNRLKNAPGTSDSYKKTKLIAWTINDEEEIRWLLKNGIDGIMSDDPAMVTRLVKKYVGRTAIEDSRKKLLMAAEELDQAAQDQANLGFFGGIWEFFSGSKKRAYRKAKSAYELAKKRYDALTGTSPEDKSLPGAAGEKHGITRDARDDM